MEKRDEVNSLVKKVVTSYLEGDTAALKHDSVLKEEFGLDSTEMVCIAVDLEKGLGLSLKGIKFRDLKTPDDIVNAILQLISANELARAST
jgi:acyl carrier protein